MARIEVLSRHELTIAVDAEDAILEQKLTYKEVHDIRDALMVNALLRGTDNGLMYIFAVLETARCVMLAYITGYQPSDLSRCVARRSIRLGGPLIPNFTPFHSPRW